MSLPSSMQTSTNDTTGGTSGVTQTFGGINKNVTGVDPQILIIGGVVVVALLLLSKRGRKR